MIDRTKVDTWPFISWAILAILASSVGSLLGFVVAFAIAAVRL